MNEFTEEELNRMYELVDYAIEEHYELDYVYKLRDKLKLIIERLRQHQECEEFIDKILRCKGTGS